MPEFVSAEISYAALCGPEGFAAGELLAKDPIAEWASMSVKEEPLLGRVLRLSFATRRERDVVAMQRAVKDFIMALWRDKRTFGLFDSLDLEEDFDGSGGFEEVFQAQGLVAGVEDSTRVTRRR